MFDTANSTHCSYFKKDLFKAWNPLRSCDLTSHTALYVLTISQGSILSLLKRAERKERNPSALNT